jgi:hypothetical protein
MDLSENRIVYVYMTVDIASCFPIMLLCNNLNALWLKF